MMGRKKFNMKHHHNLCLDDLVSPSDLYHKIDEAIDFTFIYDLAKESYSHTGQSSLDPVVFFKIELVGFLEGIHEDRALERRIKDSLAIRWFLGYDLDEPLPIHSTISRTRKDRISKALYQAVFDHILGICIRCQLVKGHHQSIDSTLLKANASLDSLEVLQPKVLAHYEESVKSNAGESSNQNSHDTSVSPSKPLRRDQEAKAAKKPGFPGAACYKASVSVDKQHGVITHAQVDEGSKNDSKLLKPIIRSVKYRLNRFGCWLKSLAMDKGFYSAANLKAMEDEHITAYVAPRLLSNIQGDFAREQFCYDAGNDHFICPEGKVLRFRQFDTQLPHLKRYRARTKDCCRCPQKERCTKGKARTIQISLHEDLIQSALKRSQGSAGKEFDRLRRIQAEGAYAHIKEVLKFRKLYSLGLENAGKKFLMACSVINLKKLLRTLDALSNALCAFGIRLFVLFKKRIVIKHYWVLIPT